MEFASPLQYLPVLIRLVVPLAGVVVIALRLRSTARVLGVVGCILLSFEAVTSILFYALVPTLARGSNMALAFGFANVLFSIIDVIGLALLIGAAIVGRNSNSVPGHPRPVEQHGPGGADFSRR
ncbi:hypothetical protein GCM10009841_00990 [Microlunatus panaciterrae]|jgi:hypothetical protein|uniref:Uncharacterized protein n=1 Tax=Microlunatus panaciterrae TaxID=400768 RepID=A0ABS2RJJ7_9ACTN|nr:hypothetical protein [Microlunatus panaciterrae]MBM7799181.1 hypothetical protein [Microlunatus panaciterrae]